MGPDGSNTCAGEETLNSLVMPMHRASGVAKRGRTAMRGRTTAAHVTALAHGARCIQGHAWIYR